MAFDTKTRNRLNQFVGDARALLTEKFTEQCQVEFGMNPETGEVTELERLSHLDDAQRQTAIILRETLNHYYANLPTKQKDQAKDYQSLIQRIVREQAFTILNRLCAIRMAEARDLVIESIGAGVQSKGFQLYQHVCGNSLGETGAAYQQYLLSLFDEFGVDLPVLFDRYSPQGRLFPRETVLTELIGMINDPEINPLWAEDETIGWIYQYFNSKEERKAMRDASQAPRNSRELAVRNQFFTPRYVVEFLTDNTLGRIWYEMRKGETGLKESCQYLVRRPNEIFLAEGEEAPETDSEDQEKDLTQEELLNQPVHIPHRPLKDPREIRMLDPACGSMHFGLYAFDLYLKIYAEFWDLVTADPAVAVKSTDLPSLTETYDSREAFVRDAPRLIIEHNIHGIDIDPRAVQIAGLSLWLRAQRAWKSQDIAAADRPQVTRSNIVCAEPMPGDQDQLDAFCQTLHPAIAQMVTAIFEEMKLAGEAGSLLKIEEEISSLVTRAKKQYQDNPPEQKSQGNLFGLPKNPKQQKLEFDLSGITDQQFFEQAEETIYEALRKYASETSEGGFRRKLFAGDAEKGFAFMNLCQNRFDVALMNPPFGEGAKKTESYERKAYPDAYQDVAYSFISRAMQLTPNGLTGAITTRTGFFLSTLTPWRETVLDNLGRLQLIADLGYGVLDAVVETAAFIIRPNSQTSAITVIDLLQHRDKNKRLTEEIRQASNSTYHADAKSLSRLPNSPLAYWAPQELVKAFNDCPSFEPTFGEVKRGVATGDNTRFLRLFWEVPSDGIGIEKRWVWYAKGGEYSPYRIPTQLLLKWQDKGRELCNFFSQTGKLRSRPQNLEFFGRAGLAYASRTTSGFGPRTLHQSHGFDQTSNPIFTTDRDSILAALGILMTRPAMAFVEFAVGGGDTSQAGTAARDYTNGIIGRIPFPVLDQQTISDVKSKTKQIVDLLSLEAKESEVDPLFVAPALWTRKAVNLSDAISNICHQEIEHRLEQLKLTYEIEEIAAKTYGLRDASLEFLDHFVGPHSWSKHWLQNDDALPARLTTKKCYWSDQDIEVWAYKNRKHPSEIIGDEEFIALRINERKPREVKSLVSYLIGVAFGHWQLKENDVSDGTLLAELPRLQPGRADLTDGSALILENDSLAGLLHEIIQSKWSDEASTVESFICDALEANSVADYLTRPGSFFDDHLSRTTWHSRSAPIYWPISTESGSYTLWFYYHRLTDQTLYKAVNDFVDPKLKQTNRQLSDLRAIQDRSSAQEKELAQLTELESELEQFKADLLEIAAFWKPNLNDGVQITAAPLWKFFRLTRYRNRLKKTWSELESGKYDWAHLALSIWPNRVVREKCTTDRSIAIAHDLEEKLWHEVEVTKVSKSGRESTKIEWQPRDLTDAQLKAIVESVKSGKRPANT